MRVRSPTLWDPPVPAGPCGGLKAALRMGIRGGGNRTAGVLLALIAREPGIVQRVLG